MKLKIAQRSYAFALLGLALAASLPLISLRAETTPAPAASEAIPRFAIGAEIGTAGFGPLVVLTASKHLTANIGYTFFNYDREFTVDEVNFKGKLKLSNLQAVLNWHPFAGTFHLSAGAFLTDNKITLTSLPSTVYKIGDQTYTSAQIATLNGTGKITKGVNPYVGFGWSKTPAKSGFGMFFDVGVLFISSPEVHLVATGPATSDPTFTANRVKAENKVNDKITGSKYSSYYPVVQLGLMYRF